MRSFDERKTEIFRRSEERIRQRNTIRSRLLAVCIPLVLCISLSAVLVMPQIITHGGSESGKHHNVMDETLDMQENSVHEPACTVQVSCEALSVSHSDADSVAAIQEIIRKILTVPETLPVINDQVHASPDESFPEDSFTITVTDAEGAMHAYTLTGFTLIDRATQTAYTLTALERNALLKALCIPSD